MSGYGVTNWVDGETPALSAANLNKIETGLLHALGFDTAAELRAVGRPTAVQSAWLRGGAAVGDGDGGQWRWDAASTATDDGVAVLLPDGHTGAGRWVRVLDRPSARAVIPVGVMEMFAGETAPVGWLLCQGQAISRTGVYAALFAVIGTRFGPGNGTSTFNVPDLRERVPTGAGATHALGSAWGSTTPALTIESVSLTLDQLPSHTHAVTDPGHGHGVTDPGHVHGLYDPGHTHNYAALLYGVTAYTLPGGASFNYESKTTYPRQTGIQVLSHATGISVDSRVTGITAAAVGGGAGHSHGMTWGADANAQPAVSVNFIIKY